MQRPQKVNRLYKYVVCYNAPIGVVKLQSCVTESMAVGMVKSLILSGKEAFVKKTPWKS